MMLINLRMLLKDIGLCSR